MKKLTLPYKKSKSSKLTSHQKKALASIIVIGCFLIVGCAMKLSESTEKSSELQNLVEKISPAADKPISIKSIFADKEVVLATLNSAACDQIGKPNTLAKKQSWSFPIDSSYGNFVAAVNIPPSPVTEKIDVTIDGQDFLLKLENIASQPNIESICKQWQNNPAKVIVEKAYFDSFAKIILETSAPNCDFNNISEQGWNCKLANTSADYAEKTVASLQKRIIQKWSRQPYLYTRRLSVTKNFAADVKKNPEQAVTRLCSILTNSLETELPLVMANQRWQKAACQSNLSNEKLHSVIAHGLHLATQELDFLYLEAEKSSRVGLLQVKIPRELATSKNIWISLHPVLEQIDPAATASTVATNTVFSTEPTAKSCWHPLFSQSLPMVRNASELGILSQSTSGLCEPKNETQTPETKIQSYVDKSIIGETEFLIENFNSKVLRLPVGEYNYKAYELPVNATEWEPSEVAPRAEGTISWRTNRPRVVINSW